MTYCPGRQGGRGRKFTRESRGEGEGWDEGGGAGNAIVAPWSWRVADDGAMSDVLAVPVILCCMCVPPTLMRVRLSETVPLPA
jgi:hypothetical protein